MVLAALRLPQVRRDKGWRIIVVGRDERCERTEFDAFNRATWRGTSVPRGEVMGVSFDLEDGAVVRLLIDLRSARHLSESIAENIADYGVRVQSSMSSEMPSADVS